MTKIPLILGRPDASCGKVFHIDRRAAEEHRIVLEVWNRATGGNREGYRLSVYQCTRCGGFHVGQKRAETATKQVLDRPDRFLPMELGQAAFGYLADNDPLDDDSDDESETLTSGHRPAPSYGHLETKFELQHAAS